VYFPQFFDIIYTVSKTRPTFDLL